MSTVGYRPSYQKLCRYCHEIDVVITYEHIGNDRWKYVARNYNTGTIHNCYNKREQTQVRRAISIHNSYNSHTNTESNTASLTNTERK